MSTQEGFNFRIPLDIKTKCKQSAKKQHVSLNHWLIEAVQEKLTREENEPDKVKAEVAKLLNSL